MSDVLMIYYEGSERIDDKGHFFESFAPPGADIFGMSCDKLVSYLSDVPGAHVLLLDVERPARAASEDHPRDHIERWGDDYPDARAHVVVMRCARRAEPGHPGQVRLMPVLRKHMPQADRLSKLVALIEEAIAESEERNLLVFTKYLPTELADLMVGPPP